MHLTLRAAALITLALTTSLTGALASPAAAQDRRVMSAGDVVTLNRLAAPTVSADGHWAAYQLTTTDAVTLVRTTGLYLLDLRAADAAPMRIADLSDANETGPAFSPDGRRLYFISGKSGRDQLWFVGMTASSAGAGAAMTVTDPVQASDVAAAVAGFRIAPNGQRVVMWGDTADGSPQFGGRAATSPSMNRPGPGTARVYDRLFVRHWDTWEDQDSHNRAFVFALDSDGRVTGDAIPVRAEANGDVPSNPFGGAEEIIWSAYSDAVFFAMRVDDRNEPTSTNFDIYMANLGGTATAGPAINLTPGNSATDTLPAASPDGRSLAYVAMARPGYEADRQVLMLRDLRSGTVRALTQDWDRSVDSIAWAPDSRSIVVTVQDTLEHPAYRITIRSGAVERLTDRGTIGDVSTLPRGGILYSINSVAAPNDLVIRGGDGTTRRLTNVNAAQLGALNPVGYEQFSFTGANGDRVYGQVITPQGTSGPLPTVLMVHGGPQGSFGNGWSSRWNPALWASQGYAVVTIDFHGSTGYGQAFTDSINRNWGGWPLEDLRLGFAAAAASNAQVDTANACAAGASYGGYMMNWIAGNWPDGFKCLITHAGVFDLRAMSMETEELWFDEYDHGGPWWTRDPVERERWNPVNHVTSWRTPTLVIHGERDYRIPYSQSLAVFTVLQRQGIESRLVMFPDENHWVQRPRNSLQWHGEVFGWLDRHIGPRGAEGRAARAASAAAPPAIASGTAEQGDR